MLQEEEKVQKSIPVKVQDPLKEQEGKIWE